MKLIIEYQYFAPSILYSTLYKFTHVEFEQYETFQKRSFRNRLVLAGGAGAVALAIPLRGGRNQHSLTRDIIIDDRTKWQLSHWRTITSCYNRSPWFDYYRDELNEIYSTRFELLADWNLTCFEWALKKLGLKLTVSLTEQWSTDYDESLNLDWRNKLLPGSIQSTFPMAPRYRQVFSERNGFLPHLSILDLLFCEGKNAGAILRGERTFH